MDNEPINQPDSQSQQGTWPHSRYFVPPPYFPPPKKDRKWLIVGLILLGVFTLLCMFFGCAIFAMMPHTDQPATIATVNISSDTSDQNPSPQHFTVGQTVKSGDWEVTVLGTHASRGDELNVPKSGGGHLRSLSAF